MSAMRTRAAALLGTGLLVVSGWTVSGVADGSSPSPSAGPRRIGGVEVTGYDFSFEPETIEAEPGAVLSVDFMNLGLQPHNIAFHLSDGDTPAVADAIGSILVNGESERMTFVVPAPGEYTFVCDVHPLKMRGTLIVRGAVGTLPPERGATYPGDVPIADLQLANDPRIDPGAFVTTTFARGLPYPTGMVALDDGSLMVAINVPAKGGFASATGALLRMEDLDGDGEADRTTPVAVLKTVGRSDLSVFTDLPGAIVQMRRSRDLLFLTARQRGRTHIVVLRAGLAPGDPYRLVDTLQLTFPKDHLHDTYALAVRDGVEPRSTEIYFNVGSGLNAQADAARIEASGLADATLVSGSVYRLTLADDGTAVHATDLRLIATGLRNAAGMAFHPSTGDLYLQDNGMEHDDDPDEPINADELDMIPTNRLGVEVPDFGFPDDYIAYRTGERVGTGAEQPIVAFQPVRGSEAQGAAEIVFAPAGFPTGFQGGLFVGFHGRFTEAGIANEENPLMFVDPGSGSVFDFVPNDAPDVGHLDSLLATRDALFVADLNRLGDLSTSSPDGVIYRIAAMTAP